MSLTYDGKKIIPAPILSLTKEYIKTDDGAKLGSFFKLTLTGTILPFRGSPDSTFTLNNPNNSFWTLGGEPADEAYAANNTDFANIQRKQEAIRWLFSNEGMNLEWQAGGGQEVVKCNPRVVSVSFDEGQWADRCNYTIELEADKVLVTRGASDYEDTFDYDLIVSASEDWQFDEVDGKNGKVYSVNHTVNAKGIQGYELNGQSLGLPWDKARLWCESKIVGSIPSDIMNAVVGVTTWIGGSYVKGIGIGQNNGTYSITETWSMGESNTFIEKSFSLSRKYQDDEGVEVDYQGTIYGLSEGERIGGANAIAQAKLLVPNIGAARTEVATALAGNEFLDTNSLSKIPKQRTVTINNNNGSVAFSFQWATDEADDYTVDVEGTLSHTVGDGLYVMSYTINIEGKGSTPAIRLANANTGLPATDAAAHALALSLLSGQIADLPVGTVISTDPINKSTSVNEKRGTISATWSWNSSATNDVTIQVENDYPKYITAQIPVPGRLSGPIIQRMNTKTAQRITVTYTSKGVATKPNEDTIAGIMDVAGSIPPALGVALFLPGSYILETDSEVWNPTTKQYNRTRTHTVTED